MKVLYKKPNLLTQCKGVSFPLTTPEFGYEIDEDGVQVFRQVGEIDDFAEIQKDKDATDIAFLSRQYARLSGQEQVPEWSEEDVSEMPDNLLDMFNLIGDCRSQFDSLPVDVRAKFNNDFPSFLRAVSDGSAQPVLFPKKEEKFDVIQTQSPQGDVEGPKEDGKSVDPQ